MANPDPSAQAAQIDQAVWRIAEDETMYAMKYRSNNSRTGIAGTVMNPYSEATIRFDENTKRFIISHLNRDVPISDIRQAIVTLHDIWFDDLMKLAATDQSKFAQAIESIFYRQQLIMDDPAHPGENKEPEIKASGGPIHYYDVGNDRDPIDYWSNIQDKVEQLHESAIIHKRVEQEYEVWVHGRKYDTVKTRAEAEQIMLTAQVDGILDRVIQQESQPRQADTMPTSSATRTPSASAALSASGSRAAASSTWPGVSSRSSGSPGVGCVLGSIAAFIVIAALIVGLIGQALGNLGSASDRNTSQSVGSSAMVPAGKVLYHTDAPGQCDNQGGNWAQNQYAAQTCDSGGLSLAGPDCPCPLGVVALATIPSQAYPQNFVVQVTAQLLSSGASDFFGFKFRQQSEQDDGQGRGGYAFLYAQNGQWEFNKYDANGTHHILAHQTLSTSVASSNTLDLIVNGNHFSFYMDGALVSEQSDGTYSQGFLCLVAEPGARVLYQDMKIYSLP